MEEKLEKYIKKDLDKIISELKRTNSISIYYLLCSYINDLMELIFEKGLYIKLPKEFDFEYYKKSTKKYELAFERLVNFDANKSYDFNLKFTDMSNILMKRYVPLKDSRSFSYFPFNKSIELAKDFFKDLDEEMYEYFIKLLDTPRFITVDSANKRSGYVIWSNYLLDDYVVVMDGDYIIDFFSIIHEVTHSFNFSKIKHASFNERENISINCLYEVPSFFIELLGIDYLNKISYSRKDVEFLKQDYDYELIILLNDFNNTLNYSFSTTNKYLSDQCYAYGTTLAYHFYDNYLIDKKKTIDDIKKFMIDYKNYDREYLLNNYGLNINNITNENKLIKHLDNSLMRL